MCTRLFLNIDGSDFFSNTNELKFENGSISGTVECTNLEIIDDTIKEGNESFALVFCPGGDEAVHLQDHSATVHIIDDDRMSTIFEESREYILIIL